MALFDVTGAAPTPQAPIAPPVAPPAPAVNFGSAIKNFNPSAAPLGSGLSIGAGGQLAGGTPALSPNAQTANLLLGPMARPTSSGGYVLHPGATTGTNSSLQNPNVEPLASGGNATFNQNGSLASVNPNPFSIGTGSVSSNALGSTTTLDDIMNKRNAFADYAQQLFQATKPSSDYLNALTGYQNAKQAGMQIQADFLTNPQYPGDTFGFAQGVSGRQTALNALDQNAASNALNVQQTIRSGNIDAYKALVSAASPQSVSPGSSLVSPLDGSTSYSGLGGYTGVQAIQTYTNLQQQFPDAQIPPYNQSLPPEQNLQMAQAAAAQSPSFQSRNLVPVSLPGGGISYINKNQLVTGANGQTAIISSADASQAEGFQKAIGALTQQKADTQAAITTADANFPLLLSAARQAGVNNNSPLFNQLQQAVARKTLNSDALAALNTLVPSLQTEYSRIIARGATPDDNTRNSAKAIVDGTYSLSQLQAVYNTVKKEGQNVIKGYDSEIQNSTASLNALYNKGTPMPSSTSSSSGGKIDLSQYAF